MNEYQKQLTINRFVLDRPASAQLIVSIDDNLRQTGVLTHDHLLMAALNYGIELRLNELEAETLGKPPTN
jgi:hypothetical protein